MFYAGCTLFPLEICPKIKGSFPDDLNEASFSASCYVDQIRLYCINQIIDLHYSQPYSADFCTMASTQCRPKRPSNNLPTHPTNPMQPLQPRNPIQKNSPNSQQHRSNVGRKIQGLKHKAFGANAKVNCRGAYRDDLLGTGL